MPRFSLGARIVICANRYTMELRRKPAGSMTNTYTVNAAMVASTRRYSGFSSSAPSFGWKLRMVRNPARI